MPAFLLVASGLLLEVCVCRNQFSLQLMLQTLEAGWGSRFQTQICFLDFGDVFLSKCHVKTSNVYNCKRLPSHRSKAGLLKIAYYLGVRSSQCKNGLKHNRMVVDCALVIKAMTRPD